MSHPLTVPTLVWPNQSQFTNRVDDLSALERWWESPTRDALALIGRRRVGKSWLFRAFADGKPAIVLVADRRLVKTQMQRFAEALETIIGVRPDIPDLRALIALLYRLGREQKILAVIDEFPYLLPDGAARQEILSEVQAVMEDERDQSQTKLVLCGSLIGQMNSLIDAESPLHGRLQPLNIWPLDFAEGAGLREQGEPEADQIIRFAIAGGMARYLAELGQGASVRELICERVLDRRGPLFNDPRAVLEQELRSPATHFTILEKLAEHPAQTEHLTSSLELDSAALWPIIHTLQNMRLLESSLPIGAPATARSHKHAVTDGFIRFWFRFVFPHQEALESGLRSEDLWASEIDPALADFLSPTFEHLCQIYTRRNYGATAPRVGSWWGKALNKSRRAKTRFTEEVDVVAARHRQLKIVGECKWTTSPMPASVLRDLREHKIPAIAEEKRLNVSRNGPDVLLFSRSGFSDELKREAADNGALTLVDLRSLIAGLR